MLSSSKDVLLKLAETTSPQKLFPYDCITLYYTIYMNSYDLLQRSQYDIILRAVGGVGQDYTYFKSEIMLGRELFQHSFNA